MLNTIQLKENLYNALVELGLTEQEINLYTLSLSLGPSSIVKLAECMGIPRPNVYKLIAGLERHDLAAFSDKKRHGRFFIVESPTKLSQLLNRKRESVSRLENSILSLMPDLLALYHQGDMPTKIRVFEGKEGYLKALRQIFEEVKDEVYFFGSLHDFLHSVTRKGYEELVQSRIEKRIHLKSLILPSPESNELALRSKDELREVKILSEATPFTTSFQLSQNKILLWQPNAPLALLIEDEYIVAMFRSMFLMLWNQME